MIDGDETARSVMRSTTRIRTDPPRCAIATTGVLRLRQPAAFLLRTNAKLAADVDFVGVDGAGGSLRR
jgi:hypothetical protein